MLGEAAHFEEVLFELFLGDEPIVVLVHDRIDLPEPRVLLLGIWLALDGLPVVDGDNRLLTVFIFC